MIIKFTGRHKSLETFESEVLENFCVITGKNGCGKSQLIELIELTVNGKLSPLLSLYFEPTISKIQIEGVKNNTLISLNHRNWSDKIKAIINEFIGLGKYTKLLGEAFIQNSSWPTSLKENSIVKSITHIPASQVEELVINSVKEIDPNWLSISRPFSQVEDAFPNYNVLNENRRKAFIVAIFIAKYKNKKITDLIDADFYLTPIPEYLVDEPKLFGSQLEYIFYNYAKRRDQNRRLYFDKIEDKKENNATSDNEFIATNVPPWTLINNILSQHSLDFQFKGIEKSDFSSDADISFQLVKGVNSENIEFQHLSSGEKVIIGLIIKLFTSDYYSGKLEFPELIVLDEPDAHLHPGMSKLLIDVLKETFVKKLGVKVIFVTHSPSTVALCPDNSIYQLTNTPVTSLKRIDKNDALKLLTEFIPTLSIDYKNHKQVFVESSTDIRYYQTIFDKLNQQRNYPFKLYFISNSNGKGNCDQVKKIVADMRNSGNTTCFGIIDWDLKNSSSEHIKVHGINKRYSIENYLYDPIYLSILFMDLSAHNIYSELNIEETTNHYSIGNNSDESLQKIVNWFFDKYYKIHNASHDVGVKQVEYFNGKKIDMPNWFLEFKGHDYEQRLKQVFSALERYTSEGQLQEEIIKIIGKCYPFIPKDSEMLIEEIINNS